MTEQNEDRLSFETVDLPKRRYNLITGHGSTFYVEFLPTMRTPLADGQEAFVGEMFVEGIAVSTGKLVQFAGIGWLPEVGGHLTVEPYTISEDGESEERAYELITEVQELEDQVLD